MPGRGSRYSFSTELSVSIDHITGWALESWPEE